MAIIGTSLAGTYNLVPPPGVGGFGFKSIKRGLKKAAKKTGKVAKKTGKVAKKAGKVSVRVATKPVKAAVKAGAAALKAVAKLAAKPIVLVFRKLARRRAAYLAYKARGNTRATPAEKKQAAAWAVNKVNRGGPIGKLAVRILKYVGAHQTAGVELGRWDNEPLVGITGAEIAAASTAIISMIVALMKVLNKPGEAPANPAAAAKQPEPAEPTEIQEVPADEAPAEEANEEASEETSTEGYDPALALIVKIAQRRQQRRQARTR